MAPSTTPQGTPTDADAVARAATERAEKLEKQNGELKKQLEAARLKRPEGAALAELQAEVDRLRADREEMRGAMQAGAEFASKMSKAPKPLAPEHRGTRKYRTRAPCYRQGEWKPAGSIVTVTDERPSKTWVPLVEKASAELVEVEAPEGSEPEKQPRASDQQV